MDRLDELESESIYILREAYCKLGKLGMLWSIGKDSTVLLWLAQKAFFGHVPFPFIHTESLKQVVKKYGFDGLIVGVRRDEEGSRSKERVFSERNESDAWDYTNQLLSWTEVDIWEYIRRENIPIIDLYFAKNGKRYRSLGCACCTGQIDSNADTLDKIIEELKTTNVGERAGRAQDNADSYALQKLRRKGYM